jgi:hypothetical protein
MKWYLKCGDVRFTEKSHTLETVVITPTSDTTLEILKKILERICKDEKGFDSLNLIGVAESEGLTAEKEMELEARFKALLSVRKKGL